MTQDGGTELAGCYSVGVVWVAYHVLALLLYYQYIYTLYIYTIYALILLSSATIKADGSDNGSLNPLWHGRPVFRGGTPVWRVGRFVH